MRLTSLICALAFAAGAQTTSDGVNVSVSRSVNIPADQAEFVAVVAVGLDTTQQQVAQAFRDLGATNPVVVNTALGVLSYSYPPQTDTQFFYQISFTTPPEAVKDLARKLDVLRAALPEGFASLQYAAAFSASPAAVESARKAALPSLISDARAKAQGLAEIAGVKLGSVAGVADYSTGYGYAAPAGYLLGNFLSSGSFSSSYSSSGTQYTFSATIKFATQ
jgi:uncharacterized protein YggE